jgi:hypothetical protein
MRLFWGWSITAVLAVALKLFTYEYSLSDDPTCGIAARSSPSLVNLQRLNRGDLVLLTDENDFPGSGVYQALVSWGYLVILIAGPVIYFARRRRRA